MTSRRWKSLPVVLLGIAIVVFVAAALVVGSPAPADDRGSSERRELNGPALSEARPALPRPDESRAVSLAEARGTIVAGDDVLRGIVDAIEAGDVNFVLDAAVSGDFCARTFREPPPECASGASVRGVYLEGSSPEPYLMPIAPVSDWVGEILGQGFPELTLIATETGTTGRYYLVFEASAPTRIGGSDYGGVGVVIEPGQAEPVRWLRLIISADNGLEWLQVRAAEAKGNPRFDLVAPETIADWPGAKG